MQGNKFFIVDLAYDIDFRRLKSWRIADLVALN